MTDWTPLIAQGRKSIADPEFDARERNYKLEIAERLQDVVERAASGDDWVAAWRSAIGSAYDGTAYNLTNWRQHQWFDQWVQADQGARAAVAAFSDREADPLERFGVFGRAATQAEERDLVRRDPGSALTLGSLFNFGVDYATVPLVRVRVFDEAMDTVGYERYRGSDLISRYRHYLEFCRPCSSICAGGRAGPNSGHARRTVHRVRAHVRSRGGRYPRGARRFGTAMVLGESGPDRNAELAEGILWAPLLSKNGQKQHHWERMDELQPGDMVIHYSGAIRAVSRVDSPAVLATKPAAH